MLSLFNIIVKQNIGLLPDGIRSWVVAVVDHALSFLQRVQYQADHRKQSTLLGGSGRVPRAFFLAGCGYISG